MSKVGRRADSTSTASTKRLAEDGDICPVCKSSRYLNPDMRFKINPECYHKMCEACVERIYGHGPAPCPIAGCARTLRRKDFRVQTFGDLKIEREVDIRKRVVKAMTKEEADFETLRDYNDYLEQVEDITWNLILNIDVEDTERRLRRWEDHVKSELQPGAIRRAPEPIGSANPKKGPVHRKVPNAASGPAQDLPATGDDRDAGFSFHGLKKRVAPPKEAPIDPFGGWSIEPQYYILQDDYEVDWYAAQKRDTNNLVGNYDIREYGNRTLREAFGGFGVFIEDEINARGSPSTDAAVGTIQVATVAKDVNMDDVF